jgi:hypothetical protein
MAAGACVPRAAHACAELALPWALHERSEGGANSPIHRTMAGTVEKRANGAYWQEALSSTDAYIEAHARGPRGRDR